MDKLLFISHLNYVYKIILCPITVVYSELKKKFFVLLRHLIQVSQITINNFLDMFL